ncbi:hypothetical protein R3X25_03020 [Lutibacter sp. TH_r2]|uniref:hypothetical protein n=1 Tax=Lutibacter sp. TH_r2 TaxID=3082083 RepID=UPI0029529643|nr:hypothetical protein [Lutibacter sp. TH_r2]MDV7186241.1 hypothetical protein [Lutibacter sp. TH_r2]
MKNDSVLIDSVSISPFNFKVLDSVNSVIDTSTYKINFSKSLLVFKTKNYPTSIQIQYTSYPDFLTKTYYKFNKKLIVPNTSNTSRLYSLKTPKNNKPFQPFEGLNAVGNITRGFTIGNNQNGVSNSSLDLQIEGKLSETVTLKASIVDTNLPIQENGNTYELNEFDRVFIELSSKNWSINAGDIYLNNSETNFLNFNKKVSGLGVNATIKNKKSSIDIQTSGAVVKGKYNKIELTGVEGNQGPYQLSNFNNEYILILSGTEEIYINGNLLKRGEENDYTIDYNNAELTFNTTFPITADMRITAEYQYSNENYTRFVTYNNISYKSKKLNVTGYFYNENDLKNNPLELDLSDEQKEILANAGNNSDAMETPSAYLTPYSEDKILYTKTVIGSEEIFEYSTIETDELYTVSFSYIGENQGDYVLSDVIAIGNIYEYVGLDLGNYNPVIQLTPPTKLQLAVIKTEFNPSEKTNLYAETAFSTNDENLFSTIDDEENNGFATKFGLQQVLFDKKWKLKTDINYDFINENFESIERFQSVEFNRDWNIDEITGNQALLKAGLTLSKPNHLFKYDFQKLNLNNNYSGNKHSFTSFVGTKNLTTNFSSSILKNENSSENGTFSKVRLLTKYNFKKSWLGTKWAAEKNDRTTLNTQNKFAINHKFNEYEAFFGVGDSTNVYTQFGANFRNTDSIQNNKFQRVNNAKTFYINSNLINSKTSKLQAYINYRTVNNTNFENEESLNSRLTYSQQLFNQFISFSTIYQTISGSLAQQDFRYIKTEAGQGYYTWNDYNGDGIKDLDEFEIAQFSDEAEYLRVILTTIQYLPTHQNKFTQSLTLNAQQWSNKKGIKKALSHFTNQTFILIDSKREKQLKKFNLNPFDISNNNILGLNFNLNNSLYFNRAKKKYSTTYSFIKSKVKSTTTIDNLSNTLQMHQLKFEHKIGKFWQFNLEGSSSKNETNSQNYNSRNYELNNTLINPKLSYYYNDDAYFSIFYEFKNKENTIGDLETLKQQNIGAELNFSTKENNLIKTEINLFNNTFKGNSNSSVAYQMLEGLQPGKNYTWSLLFNRKIGSILNLSFNYLGRKSETSNAIHTGSIQLKAIF